MGPVMFSWQAAASGNSAAIMSSDSMRWMGGGLRLPLRNRSTMSARLRFQRQRDWKTGWSSTAWVSVSRMVSGVRQRGTSASGKLWWGPSEMTTASSLAAAWSSKLKLRRRTSCAGRSPWPG